MVLLNVRMRPPAPEGPSVYDSTSRNRFLVYLPLAAAVFLILLPHPSFLIMVTSHYLKTLRLPAAFWTHLFAVYFLTLMVFSSLIVCVVRDPGRVVPTPSSKSASVEDAHEDEANIPLLDEEDATIDANQLKSAGRWCRRCEIRRPERAHHCSTCGRCVLKMDHHCPWLGGNCVGYRTYPSFLHFLFSATLLAAYIMGVALSVMVHLISDPFSIDPRVTPLHSLFLVMMGAIFALTMGSFLSYHVYLVSTNQTTLEHMSPFFLLRYLPASSESANDISTGQHTSTLYPYPHPVALKRYPPPPSSPRSRPKGATTLADPPTPPMSSPLTSPLSSPTIVSYPPHTIPPYTSLSSSEHPGRIPEEHMLSPAQRRLVQHMHGRLRPYDIGFRANWAQVFGGIRRTWAEWAHLLLWGGTPPGDGCTFARGLGVGAGLERLARELDDVRRQGSGQ